MDKKYTDIELLQRRVAAMEGQLANMRRRLANAKSRCAADAKRVTMAATLCHQAAQIVQEQARRANDGCYDSKLYRDAAGWDLCSASAKLLRAGTLLDKYIEGQTIPIDYARQPICKDAGLQFTDCRPAAEALALPGFEGSEAGVDRPGKSCEGEDCQ